MARASTLSSLALALALGPALLLPSFALGQGPTGIPVDLTHGFGDRTVYWPTAAPFALTVEAHGLTEAGTWYAANSFCAAEHGGTHLDAPIHFAEGRRTAAEIPLEDLMGSAVVVDASRSASEDPDTRVDIAAIEVWEALHGRIPDRSIVLLRTGWGDRWPDPVRYLGTGERGAEAVPELHFPGLDPAAATWLVQERRVRAVGIDTASIDAGQSIDFGAHRVLADANVPIFENVARLERVPPIGAWVIALPMKIEQGTGGPLRLVAFLPPEAE